MYKVDISMFDSTKITNVGTVNTLINNLRNIQEPIPYLNNADDLSKVLCVLPKLDNPRIIRQHEAFFLFGIYEGMKENMAILDVATIKMRIPSTKKMKY